MSYALKGLNWVSYKTVKCGAGFSSHWFFCSTAQFFYCKHWVFPDGQARLWRAGKVKRDGCQAASTKVGQWMSKMFLGKKKMQEAVCCSTPSSKIREEEKKKKLERKQVRLKWETHVERILVKKKQNMFPNVMQSARKKKCSVLFWRWIAEGFFEKSVKACLTANRSIMGTIGFSSKTPLIGWLLCLWGRNLDTMLAQPSLARIPARF